MSIISFIYAFYNYVPLFARYRFIHKLIRFSRNKKKQTLSSPSSPPPILQYPITTTTTTTEIPIDKNDFSKDVKAQRKFVQWLQRDGVFLLHLLKSHAGEPVTIKCLEHLIEIWQHNYAEGSKLADRLLKNHFHFSK